MSVQSLPMDQNSLARAARAALLQEPTGIWSELGKIAEERPFSSEPGDLIARYLRGDDNAFARLPKSGLSFYRNVFRAEVFRALKIPGGIGRKAI